MKLKSRVLLLGILSMLAVIMNTINTTAAGQANADADSDANADANAVANADANADATHAIQSYDDPPNPSGCGEIKYKEKKIVGGQEAKFASHPWLGILFAEVQKGGYQICGCDLLSPKWCMTAAHCQFHYITRKKLSLDKLFVRFGEHNYIKQSEPLPSIYFDFETRKIHPKYDPHKYTYDISMMKVNGTVTYADNILPICLPKSNVNIFGRTANVAGWGINDYPKKLTPRTLQEVDVRIITDDKCKKWWRKANRTYNDHITSFCAGYKRGIKSSCQGDSGGALTVIEDGKHVAVGLVSYGVECGLPNLPSVYVRVQYFVEWILKCMK